MKKYLIIMVLCACSNIISAQIKINSEPSGAKVYQEGKYIGETPCNASPNMKSKQLIYDIDADRVSNPSQPPYSIEFTITKDGYEPATVYFEGKYEYHKSGWSGGGQKYYLVKPKSYNLFATLKKVYQEQPAPTNIEQQKQALTQPIIISNGQQNLVPAIQPATIETNPDVRWNFDSEPEGAKVFWKVKSSVPDIVKSTELLYLGKTPFNEKKPLNVKGLNSDNSDKVEIEIEIVKKGYVKQNKKFSGSLLVDQQEISWFFDLEEEPVAEPTIEVSTQTETVSDSEMSNNE